MRTEVALFEIDDDCPDRSSWPSIRPGSDRRGSRAITARDAASWRAWSPRCAWSPPWSRGPSEASTSRDPRVRAFADALGATPSR